MQTTRNALGTVLGIAPAKDFKCIGFFKSDRLLGVLQRWAAAGSGKWEQKWILPLAGAAYGLLLEGAQQALGGSGRGFSWGDAAANLAGVVGGWWWAGRRLADAEPGGWKAASGPGRSGFE